MGTGGLILLCCRVDTTGEGQLRNVQFIFQQIVNDLDHAFHRHGLFCDNKTALRIRRGKFRFEGFTSEDLSDFSGPVTNCFSQMDANENGVKLSVDLRLPVSVTKEQILEIMGEKAAKYGMTVEEFDWLAPIHVPKEGELINGLMEAYQEVTGDTVSEPEISAGATYARAFKGCVAYGACFPDTVLTEHEPNERAPIAELVRAAEVFKAAFEKLVVEK